MTDQRNNSAQVELGESVSLLELLIRIMVRVYLQARGNSKVAVSPKSPSQHGSQFRKKLIPGVPTSGGLAGGRVPSLSNY